MIARVRNDAVVAEIERRTQAGESAREIARGMGVSVGCAAKWANRYRERAGSEVPPKRAFFHAAAVSDEQMEDLRQLVAKGATVRAIADELGLTIFVVRRRAQMIRAESKFGPSADRRGAKGRLSDTEVAEIMRLVADGLTSREVGRRLGISHHTVASVAARSGINLVRAKTVVDTSMIESIERLAEDGKTSAAIATELSIKPSLAQKYFTAYRKRRGIVVQRAAAAYATLEQKTKIASLVRAGHSAREIARIVGLSQTTTLYHARIPMEDMRNAGALCSCGRPRFHTGFCRVTSYDRPVYQISDEDRAALNELFRANVLKSDAALQTGVPIHAVARELSAFLRGPDGEARRRHFLGRNLWKGRIGWKRREPTATEIETVHRMLSEGVTVGRVATVVNLPLYLLWRLSANFWRSAAGLERKAERQAFRDIMRLERAEARAAQRAGRGTSPQEFTSDRLARTRDPLFATIAGAVPRWLDPALRDDVISEVYQAVLSGELDRSAISANMSRFVNAATGMWADRFRSRSMDAPLFDDGTLTLGDTFADPAGEAIMDEMAIGAIVRRTAPADRGYWLQCGQCAHPWIIAPPHAAVTDIRAAAVAACCPSCGGASPKVPRQSAGLLMEGLVA